MLRRLQRSAARRSAAQGGFTLIELLVVIIILGILAAVVVFAVGGVGDKGKASAITIDARTIRTAQEAYCAQNGRYGSGEELVQGGFLSELPQYHQVFARQGDGPCNRWQYSVLRAEAAGPYEEGEWELTNAPPNNTIPVFTSRLSDGRVLVGGVEDLGGDPFDNPPIAFIWDPVGESWTQVDGHPIEPYFNVMAASLLLKDDPATPVNECASETVDNCGKVLVRERFLFDPAAPSGSQWVDLSPTDLGATECYLCEFTFGFDSFSLSPIQGSVAACGSACGKVLIHGKQPSGSLESALLYDPRTNGYETVQYNYDANRIARHSLVTPLPDGRVYFCCRQDTLTGVGTPTSDFFNPLTKTWSPGPQPSERYFRYMARPNPSLSPSPAPPPVLPSGDVLHAVGSEFSTGVTAGIYTPQPGGLGSWRPVPQCSPTGNYCAVIGSLSDGRVLARDGDSTTTYLFNPATDTWDPAGEMNGLSAPLVFAPVYLDPAEGPCGSNCGKLFAASQGSAQLFTP